MTARETVRGENPQVPARLLDDLLWTVQCGAFGPEVDTAYSRALMAGTLHFTEALLDLAGEKAGLLRYPHERDVLDRTEARGSDLDAPSNPANGGASRDHPAHHRLEDFLMTIRIDTLNNARATLTASGPWGRLAMGDATGLSAEAAHNVRAMQNTPVWAGVRASVQG